jgi:hypothetical protein
MLVHRSECDAQLMDVITNCMSRGISNGIGGA